MVIYCRCFSFGDMIEDYETIAPTNSTSVDDFHTAHSDFDGKQTGSTLGSQNVSHMSPESIRRSAFPSLAERPSNLRLFTYSELKAATKNFHPSSKIGEGGFGSVYLGVVRNLKYPFDKINVAVKLGKRGLQGHKQWVTEVNVLGEVKHPNLVKLVGYCAEDHESGRHPLLVYEYMPNRSLDDHLSAQLGAPLSWATRLKVAVDVATGLAYLHEGMDLQIIFRDFKPSNILLDSQWNAKLSDFGFARLGPPEGRTHVSIAVVGTKGYAAPEYVQTGRLTYKSDVWSYGVFLEELVTGKRPVTQNASKKQQTRLEWLRCCYSDPGTSKLTVDPTLKGQYTQKAVQKVCLIAHKCLAKEPRWRPKMSVVLNMVNRVMASETQYMQPT